MVKKTATAPDAAPASTGNPWDATPPAGESNANAEGGNGGGDAGPTSSESDSKNDLTAAEAVEQAVETAPADELPSEVKDQVTPSGENPSEAVEQATRDTAPEGVESPLGTIVNTTGEVPSEVRDQVTPHGLDIGKAFAEAREGNSDAEKVLYEKVAGLDSEEQDAIDAKMRAFFAEQVDAAHKGRVARSMELNLIDSNAHYGTAAAAALEASKSNEG